MRPRYFHLSVALLPLLLLATVSFVPTQAQRQHAGTKNGGAHALARPTDIAPAALLPATMSENFESSWPNTGWTLYDLSNDDGGEYLWGRRNCNPHSGSYAGWSVGGGAQGSQLSCLSSTYPDNTNTIAQYGPFDLSNALSASVTYYIYGSTEWDGTINCPFDRLTIEGFTDAGASDYDYYCGNWTNGSDGNGYYKRTLNLPHLLGPGQGSAWFQLVFSSDTGVGDIGMLVDDITISVTYPTPTPTDTPTKTPLGAPTSTPTKTPTKTPTDTPTKTPSGAPGGTPPPIYLPITIRAPIPTPSLPPTLACPDDKEPNNIPENGQQLTTVNRSCIGSFSNEPVANFDYYWVQPNIGQHITVDLANIPSGANYDLVLIRQDGPHTFTSVIRSEKPGQDPEHLDYLVDSNKRYFIRVSLIKKSTGAKDIYLLTAAIK